MGSFQSNKKKLVQRPCPSCNMKWINNPAPSRKNHTLNCFKLKKHPVDYPYISLSQILRKQAPLDHDDFLISVIGLWPAGTLS